MTPLGSEVVVHGSVAGTAVETGAEEGADIPVALDGCRAPVTVVLEPGAPPKPGDRIELGLAPDRVHLFDLRTGSAI